MKHYLIIALVICISACKNDTQTNVTDTYSKISELKITPIEHATMVLEYNGKTIYVDPTGGKEAFEGFPKADYILITDIHSDHMQLNTIESLDLSSTQIIAPEAVYELFSKDLRAKTNAIINGIEVNYKTFSLETIPMYNLSEEALKYHPKGRGNGYVLTFGKERIYISGDTEDIPEMRKLKDIDKAFICMNLPYTMTIESAADAVLSFKPKQIYPYHYRGTEGYSDIKKFKSIINEKAKGIEVVQLDWYPNTSEK
ncbi:MBL fold metallo-hydrolase [Lacinutrix sp. Bg11-31]|uniref:MBL fold metallo-hydrolase n=1 Tax=Lacinutrix sp. Bg11-31 TaxID=2057808 RepID=UPI000C30BA42|nr:MBL fold metallo-hydrolase [Lacinutrix sp. Bg11-31]AUC81277.1 MBL fold metallo-hydrolase [Lacinutrix sp. Bg11-31]